MADLEFEAVYVRAASIEHAERVGVGLCMPLQRLAEVSLKIGFGLVEHVREYDLCQHDSPEPVLLFEQPNNTLLRLVLDFGLSRRAALSSGNVAAMNTEQLSRMASPLYVTPDVAEGVSYYAQTAGVAPGTFVEWSLLAGSHWIHTGRNNLGVLLDNGDPVGMMRLAALPLEGQD